MLAKLIAVVIHEVRAELRRLDEQASAPAEPQTDSTHRYDPASVTAIDTERAPSWDHDKRSPAVAASSFGFRQHEERKSSSV